MPCCYFCGESVLVGPEENEEYADDVGEWWSESMQRSVLGHADCLPMGATATMQGSDPNWKLA